MDVILSFITFQHTAARRRLLKIGDLHLVKNSVSTHSRPKAAALPQRENALRYNVSTHSRPKAAASAYEFLKGLNLVSTHSRPKAAAAQSYHGNLYFDVSTHSRPKAAADIIPFFAIFPTCFNTQPPEGGCSNLCYIYSRNHLFQHTAARRRLPKDRA